MQKSSKTKFLFVIVFIFFTSCAGQNKTPTVEPSQTIPAPAATTAPTQNTSSTQQPFYITATVWSRDPIVPVLAYHQFQGGGISGATHVRLDDFNHELNSLYQAGYAMIPLENWLNGDLQVPQGKRPIIFTMDDLFYRNQIRLNPDGSIITSTGLGASYDFSQSHPDFGFSWALFSNLGDKPYLDQKNPMLLANVIAWSMDHGAIVYNHTYTHALLSQTNSAGIKWELSANDKKLNQLLVLAGRSDLIPKLGNIFSLPFGRWPHDPAGEGAIIDYKNLQGLSMQGIMNVDFIVRPKYMPAPYDPNFHRYDLPRMVATVGAVQYFVDNASDVPTAQSCRLGPLDPARSGDPLYLAEQISGVVRSGICPQGIYATSQFVFHAQASDTQLIYTVSQR